MSANNVEDNIRPTPDKELVNIADYVSNYQVTSDEALDTARNCLMDSLACVLMALQYPEAAKHLGPIVLGTMGPNGARVPGTSFQLDPVKAAWDIGALVRWLDFNDTWLAAEWGHPSDNLGAILGLDDYLSRKAVAEGKSPLTMGDILHYMVKAHEIQGVLALDNSFNRVGLDHVLLVKVASAAVSAQMLGLDKDQIIDTLSHAWVDGQSLRTYRHSPNTGSRKSWAAGDASSRAVRLAMMVEKGEMGLPSVLTAPAWGFYDVLFKGKQFSFQRPYGSYVMEQILFKISFPAEFHAQTAVECALILHPEIKDRIADISKIKLTTQESAIRIISKEGPLYNPADRDHCLQYMVAIGLLYGKLTAEHYEDSIAHNPQIDQLRTLMEVEEDERYTKEYHDPEKRSIANAIQIFFKDGSTTQKIEIEYPIGHRRRRSEGIPVLEKKYHQALLSRFPQRKTQQIYDLCLDTDKLTQTPVNEFMDLFLI
ncbi:MAG: bifunctional 2-methylcitrate dehydratase/aconitate hydratase [gamma proteobacterium symbiont of Lucinoma myriamae]|nr:bifunctional 2-methylcitrate dehydratase/aconitate hydratase [gamma proteobacterium symbiont of Lucinoma myriamae]MCU7817568.1 bifunctional 2-methylcitrate dehydratase/aconitate hydratase [gamma proteobacterium symbiont of Lucinoma myriamae]MCU7832672.1 bifunctional 2-methylcitrate dehydratase/aconitate hydratase [gamma proteobacterium symbiont of Lucinoma myriamae]